MPRLKCAFPQGGNGVGHIRLGVLPKTKSWNRVVALLDAGALPDEVARSSAIAANMAFKGASRDPLLLESLWLLMQTPLAARGPGYADDLRDLGFSGGEPGSVAELQASLTGALDHAIRARGGRTDLGELAQMAAVESIAAAVQAQVPSLFSTTPDDVRVALARLASGNRFGRLMRDFVSRLSERTLDYYLSRELANHTGHGKRFANDDSRRAFDAAVALYCREASRIVEEFAGGWFGKQVHQGDGLTREKAQRFAAYAFKKMRDELTRRQDAA
jgi:hypothetical protein